MRKYIIESNNLTEAEKGNIKEQITADIQRDVFVGLEINGVKQVTYKNNQAMLVWKFLQQKNNM